MNGINDVHEAGGAQDAPVAFCQNCGRPLTAESRRVVGSAVYCEPCLEARLGGGAGGYGPVYAGAVPVSGGPVASGVPNPGLAALLGLIPGVGAMYNEQYAKGIVHLVIFAVLVSFAHVTDVFVLFVFGWVAYMAIEAHHTARARRDGTPLPNPFGFNDIRERMGFGRAWPQGADVGAVVRDAAAAAGFAQRPPAYGGASASSARAGFGSAAPPPGAGSGAAPGAAADPAAAAGAGWGSPVDAYAGATGYGAAAAGAGYTQATGQAYAGQGYAGQSYSGQGYGAPVYGAPGAAPAYGPGYDATAGYNTQNAYGPAFVPPAPQIVAVPPASRFPAGAVWLIGLGTIFLLGTTGIFRGFPGFALVGFALIGLGVWNFFRRMTDTGLPLGDDGTPMYRLRLVRAGWGAAWLVVLGVLVLLDTFHLVYWRYSWPWLIILWGVLLLLKRAAYSMAMPAGGSAAWGGDAGFGAGAGPAGSGPVSSAAANPGTGIIPVGPTAPLARNDFNETDQKQGEN